MTTHELKKRYHALLRMRAMLLKNKCLDPETALEMNALQYSLNERIKQSLKE